ncbi:hypothetical protein JIN84_13840 [Luteolibacter yonseiensis]|uniref:Uncharacterized protein n=1 Tax=Luteolibacter yonseiensis TaxID=1144680 RepID=A0A934R665_9BACT|nr:hypothetical protein [Luteolibacter yonseiensis]MBK1816703.1 hypothetical protein [Luteolibacter yonseiensis]
MSRHSARILIVASLLAASAFAAWSWLRPYEWMADPAARGEISESLVTRDQSFYWVTVHLMIREGERHDLEIPVSLVTDEGKNIQPADSTFAGPDPLNATEIWFKFWLDSADLSRPLTLHLNGGRLAVKTTTGLPALGDSGSRNFTTNRW